MARRPYLFDASRRRFAQQLAGSASTLALALGTGKQARAAADAVQNSSDPRFLINIHTRGGADTMWFHNYCSPRDYDTAVGNAERIKVFSDRFPVSRAVQHPLHPNHLMGIGMSLFSRDDFSKMLIWKGLPVDGSHDIGNRIINCGQFSNYSASFSALTSMAYSQRYLPLPLHYTQAADSAEALFSWPGLLTGYALAVNLADKETFASFTGLLPSELNPSRRSLVNAAIDSIAQATKKSGFRLKSTAGFFDTFMNSYAAMNKVYGSGIGSSPKFLATMAAYEAAGSGAVRELSSRYPDILADSIANAGGLSELDNASATSGIGYQVRRAAYCFALGEFLVTQGFSRVVDIGPMDLGHDGHTDNGKEFASLAIKYGMLRAMIRRLGDAGISGPVPGTAGNNFLQHTTVVMTTEFDRTALIYQSVAGTFPGTNHGNTASVILAGRGIRGGAVVGDFKTAPGAAGIYSAHPGVEFQDGLPINLKTGLPDPSGTMVTSKSVFTTMLGIMGVEVPAQQITGGVCVPAVLA